MTDPKQQDLIVFAYVVKGFWEAVRLKKVDLSTTEEIQGEVRSG